MNFNVDSRESRQITFIANLVVAGGVLFFLTQTLDAFNYPKVTIVSTGTFGLVMALSIYRGYLLKFRDLTKIEYWLFGMVILIPVLASANGLTTLTTLWGSFSRANGILAKASAILLAAIYYRFSSKVSIAKFFDFALVLLMIEVIYGSIQLTGRDPVPWVNPYNNIFVTAGNPNFAAALFAILVVLSFRTIIVAENKYYKVVAIVSCILGIYMSFATRSIQGILTILAAIFLLSVLWILRLVQSKKIKLGLLSISMSSATIISLGVFNYGPLKSILYQETLSIRLHYWRVALRIIRDHPFFGVGIDQYGDFYRLYREPWFVEKYGPGLISTNAHNVGLQWGSDIGILGLVMYVSFLVVPSYLYFKKSGFLGKGKLSDLDFLYVSFFAFYLQSIISISQLSVTILGFALLGMTLSQTISENDSLSESKSKQLKKPLGSQRKASFVGLGTWWLVFCLILAPFTSYVVRKDLDLRRALQLPGNAQGVTDYGPRSKAIKVSVEYFLEDQDYVSQAVQNLFSQGDAQAGVEIAKLATQKNPSSWVGYQSQVLAYAQSGMHLEALEAAQRTLRLDPLNYNIQFNVAEQAFKTGNNVLAKKYALMVKRSAPSDSEAFVQALKLLDQLEG